MMKTIASKAKRLLRLQRYFRPYPLLRLKGLVEQAEPVQLSAQIRKAEPALEDSHGKYSVSISSFLLQSNSPEWMEASLLRYCLLSLNLVPEDDGGEKLEEVKDKLLLHFKQVQSEHEALFRKDADTKTVALEELWQQIRAEYFPNRADLDQYQLVWSNRRQTRSLASCNVGRLRVEVAAVLNSDKFIPVLEPLLYHEMCHAYLGEPKVVRGRRIMHGREFRQLERRHPRITFLDQWIENGGWEKAVRACVSKASR